MARKVNNLQGRVDYHEKNHPLIYAFIPFLLYVSLLAPLVGCSIGLRKGLQDINQNVENELHQKVEGKKEDKKNTPETEEKPQGERAEDASYFWGKVGIMINSIILIACSFLAFFAPAIMMQARSLALWSLFLLGCSVTVWVLAPAMIYVMYLIAALNISMFGFFAVRHLLPLLKKSA